MSTQVGNICQDLTGDEEGRELWETSGGSQHWSWRCRGRAGCNLHSAHLREQREEKKPLPPSRKLPFPCGKDCQLSYKNGSIDITTPHLSSAPTSHSLILSVFCWLGAKKTETGDERPMMTRKRGTSVTILCQSIKMSTRAEMWRNDTEGSTVPSSTHGDRH